MSLSQRMVSSALIRKASEQDLVSIDYLAKIVREDMLKNGLMQWTGNYPSYEYFYQDCLKEGLFVYVLDGKIVASVTVLPENDPPYKEVKWESDKALVIHRIIVSPFYQRQGIARRLFEFDIAKGKLEGYEAIKIDTHPDNIKMQKLLATFNFVYRGYLSSINRYAYERLLQTNEGLGDL